MILNSSLLLQKILSSYLFRRTLLIVPTLVGILLVNFVIALFDFDYNLSEFDETLRILQAYQYVESHPDEVCPAGWKPGEKTMKEDPKGSKEYFSAL